MRNADVNSVAGLLLDIEDDYVGACSRFLARKDLIEPIWLLTGKKNKISALVMNCGSTVIPVLCGLPEIPDFKFLKNLLRRKKIHSVQGLKNEVSVLENEIRKLGSGTSDIIDYDLMSLDSKPVKKNNPSCPVNLVLRVPQMTDLDAISPLQEGYEKEEVIPAGSVFNPVVSRINIANIIAKGRILSAQLDGKFIGKINVNAVSFTRYQVGGVYVHPDYRCLGIGQKMTYEFISSLVSEGKGVTLFVKKSNPAACRLYLSLGFKTRGDYRIAYY